MNDLVGIDNTASLTRCVQTDSPTKSGAWFVSFGAS
jgi:hypothetical protein